MIDGVSSRGLREGICKEMGEWDYQREVRGQWNIYNGSEWETYQEDDVSRCEYWWRDGRGDLGACRGNGTTYDSSDWRPIRRTMHCIVLASRGI